MNRVSPTKLAALAVASVLLVAGVCRSSAAGAERELGKVKVKGLNEISGMTASSQNQRLLWVSNDGDAGRLYAIRTDGQNAGELRLPVRVLDVEEIALGPGTEANTEYLYVGDVGDNDLRRFEVAVVRLKEPTIGASADSLSVDAIEHFRLAYPDGPHNVEAMFVDPVSRAMFLVSKEPSRATLYSVPIVELKDRARVELKRVGRLAVDNVSGGAISRNGSWILLRREDRGWLWERRSGETVEAALQGAPQAIAVRGRRQGKNGEAITFCPDAKCYYTLSEGKKPAISEFSLPSPSDQ